MNNFAKFLTENALIDIYDKDKHSNEKYTTILIRSIYGDTIEYKYNHDTGHTRIVVHYSMRYGRVKDGIYWRNLTTKPEEALKLRGIEP